MTQIFVTGLLVLLTQLTALAQPDNSDYYPSNQDFILAVEIGGSARSGGPAGATREQLSTLLVEKVQNLLVEQGFAGGSGRAVGQGDHRTLAVDTDGHYGVMLVNIPEYSDVEEVIDEMLSHREVLWAHPNYVYLGDYIEGDWAPWERSGGGDPYLAQQAYLGQILAGEAWDIQRGSGEVILAVTDDGFDLNHEDMQESYHHNPLEIPGNGEDDDENGYVDDIWGWNFIDGNNDAQARGRHGDHGTHIAGTIAADTFNGVGVAGIAPHIKVMPLKWYGSGRIWTSAVIFETYAYAVQEGARIICTSYNVDLMVDDPTYLKALDMVYDKGLLLFNSAGNEGRFNPIRSILDKALFVASVDTAGGRGEEDRRSYFSNYGDAVDLSAPGHPIWNTLVGDQYGNMQGTSMSTPVAAAVAALVWSHFPDMTADQVAHRVLTGTDDIGELNPRARFYLGTGRVNAYKSLGESSPPLTMEVEEFFEGLEFSEGLRELTVRFRGVAQVLSNPFAIFAPGADGIWETPDDRQVSLSYTEDVSYGTNFKKISFPRLSSGEYRFVIFEDGVMDPFGRSLDGDGDGVEGGDYVVSFVIY